MPVPVRFATKMRTAALPPLRWISHQGASPTASVRSRYNLELGASKHAVRRFGHGTLERYQRELSGT